MESQKLVAELSEVDKNIGQDVVEQIVSTLPPKSLMRFKCVSKNWYALITCPRFVAKQLSHSMHKKLSTTSVVLKRLVQKETNIDETDEEVLSLLNFRNDNDDGGSDEHSFVPSCEDVKIPLAMRLETRGESLNVIGHCNGIICLATANSCRVILLNPAIGEFKLLPTVPHLPDSFKGCPRRMKPDYPTLGFGYDPKSNSYKVVNVYSGIHDYLISDEADDVEMCISCMAAVYTLGTDSWREGKTYSLETQTTLLQPMNFQMYFQGHCYWFGFEQHKEINVYDRMEEAYIRNVIILFDTGDEIFDAMPLPFSLYDWGEVFFCERLLVWNESIAFCGTYLTNRNCSSLGIWVMDKFGDHWTKHFTIEISEKPLAFLRSDEILMADRSNECLFSYNLGTNTQTCLPIQIRAQSEKSAAVVYVDSIVPLLEGNKLKTGDTSSTSADFSLFKYSPFSHSMADKKWYSYSVWAFPPNDVSLRIKNVMDGLRAEFGGPEIEPHIPIVGSIRMTHDEVLSKFKSLQSEIVYSYKAKVDQVVSRNFYYQRVCLLIDSSPEISPQLEDATERCGIHFGMKMGHRPRLSLLCGNLTGEERNIAREKVGIMDESITSLSFPITRLGLYKINYRDTTLKSWEKISEYDLVFN